MLLFSLFSAFVLHSSLFSSYFKLANFFITYSPPDVIPASVCVFKMPFVILLAVAHSEVLEARPHVILTSAQCESRCSHLAVIAIVRILSVFN